MNDPLSAATHLGPVVSRTQFGTLPVHPTGPVFEASEPRVVVGVPEATDGEGEGETDGCGLGAELSLGAGDTLGPGLGSGETDGLGSGETDGVGDGLSLTAGVGLGLVLGSVESAATAPAKLI